MANTIETTISINDNMSKAFRNVTTAVNQVISSMESMSRTSDNAINRQALEAARRSIAAAAVEFDRVGQEAEQAGKSVQKMSEVTNQFKNGVSEMSSKFKNGMSKIASGVKAIGKAVGTAAIAAGTGIAALTTAAVKEYADYEQLVGGVETLFKDSAGTVQKYADAAFKTAGLSANAYMETVTSFSASLLQSVGKDTAKAAEYANSAIIDMSDNANKMGTSMELIQNAYQGFAKQNYTMLDNLKLGYGGTKEEMQRLLNDASKISGLKFNISSFADITQAIHIIQTEMDITGTTAKEASTTILGSANAMKAAWSNTMVAFVTGGDNLDTSIQNLLSSVGDFAKNLTPAIKSAVQGILDSLSSVFPALSGFSVAAEEAMQSLMNFASSDKVLGFIDSAIDAISDFGIFILELTDSESISNLFNTLANSIGEVVKAFWGLSGCENSAQFLDKVRGAIEGFAEKATPVVSVIGNIVSKLIELSGTTGGKAVILGLATAFGVLKLGMAGLAISDFITKIKALTEIGTLSAGLKTLAMNTNLVTAAQWLYNTSLYGCPIIWIIAAIIALIAVIVLCVKHWDKIKAAAVVCWDAIKTAWGAACNWFKGIWDNIKEIAVTVWDGVKSVWQSVVGWFKGIWDGVVSGVQTAWNGIVGFFQGLWDGIKSIFSNVINWIKDNFASIALFIINPFWGVFSYLYNNFEGFRNIVNNVVNAIKGFFVGLWSNIVSGAQSLWNGIVSVFTTIKNFIVGVWNGVVGFFASVWASIWGVISPVVMAIWNLINAIFTTIFSIISAIMQGIWATIVRVWTAVQTAITTACAAIWGFIVSIFTTIATFIMTVWNGIVTVATTVWTAIQTAITTACAAIWGFIVSVWNSIVTTVTTVWNSIVSIATTVWTAIQTAITTVCTAIMGVITSIWNSIVAFFTPILQAIQTAITTAWNAIKTAVSTVCAAILSVITSIWNSIKSAVTTAVNAVKSVVTSIWNNIKSVTTSVWNNIKNAISNAWTAIVTAVTNKVQEVYNKIKSKFDEILSFIGGLKDQMLQKGKDIIQGLIDGIASKINAVADKIKEVGKTVTNGIKDFFDINSPSRVMRELGQFTFAGFDIGLQDMVKRIKRTSVNMGEVVTKVLPVSGDTPTTTSKTPEEFKAMREFVSSNTTNNKVVNMPITVEVKNDNTFNNNTDIDGFTRKLANGIAQQIGIQMEAV